MTRAKEAVPKVTASGMLSKAKRSLATKQPVYEGRVPLEQAEYRVGETRYPLRYGMTAVAKIVVRERRMTDLALDPFRYIGG